MYFLSERLSERLVLRNEYEDGVNEIKEKEKKKLSLSLEKKTLELNEREKHFKANRKKGICQHQTFLIRSCKGRS